MFTKQLVQLFASITMMAISINGFAHSNVVVIPLAADAPAPDPKVLFVSGLQDDADFGGVAGADGICQGEADASPLASVSSKSFKAWLYSPDTVTFQSSLTPQGLGGRSLNLPRGALLSPSGVPLGAEVSHHLLAGSPITSFFDDCSELNCRSLFDSSFGFELASGASLYTDDGLTGESDSVALPSRLFGFPTKSNNCENYDSAVVPDINSADFNLYLVFRFQRWTSIFPEFSGSLTERRCNSPTRIMCVEQ